MSNKAGRGLQPRPERYDATVIFELCEKLGGRGNIIPRPALEALFQARLMATLGMKNDADGVQTRPVRWQGESSANPDN